MVASSPYPDPNDPQALDDPVRFFRPDQWSPDGKRLLVEFSYYPEAGGLAILKLGEQCTHRPGRGQPEHSDNRRYRMGARQPQLLHRQQPHCLRHARSFLHRRRRRHGHLYPSLRPRCGDRSGKSLDSRACASRDARRRTLGFRRTADRYVAAGSLRSIQRCRTRRHLDVAQRSYLLRSTVRCDGRETTVAQLS